MKGWQSVVAIIFICLSSYIFGVISLRNRYQPIPWISVVIGRLFPGQNTGIEFDAFGRLSTFPGKQKISCPNQDKKTRVLLVLGQSNAANHGGQRYKSNYGARIINYFSGNCFLATSPLLGSSDSRGEMWTRVANLLIERGDTSNVIVIPFAIGSTLVSRWARGGDLYPQLRDVLEDAAQKYSITDAIWHQGESDNQSNTSGLSYERSLQSVIDLIEGYAPMARIHISVATKCGFRQWQKDNPISEAQRRVAHSRNSTREGVDSDMLLNTYDRFDDCHFSQSGQEKFAESMSRLILNLQ
jgi:Carbohydrate esterase, sialic acid-specific acetylesterase